MTTDLNNSNLQAFAVLEANLDHPEVEDALSYLACEGYLTAISCLPTPVDTTYLLNCIIGDDSFITKQSQQFNWPQAIEHKLAAIQRQLLSGSSYLISSLGQENEDLVEQVMEWNLGFAEALCDESLGWPEDDKSRLIFDQVFSILDDSDNQQDFRQLEKDCVDHAYALYLLWRLDNE